jgi:ABC-type bacteriocin/lantibiotic exporter with double-glycine peptidase domain
MIEFFNEVLAFLDNGIYQFFVDLVAWVLIKVAVFQLQAQLASLVFAWDVASSIIQQLDITTEIQNALSILPPQVQQNLYFFNVVEGINLVLNAAATRFVMRMLGL